MGTIVAAMKLLVALIERSLFVVYMAQSYKQVALANTIDLAKSVRFRNFNLWQLSTQDFNVKKVCQGLRSASKLKT